jgi:hypothetical protein
LEIEKRKEKRKEIHLVHRLRLFDLGAFETLAAREVDVEAVLLPPLAGFALV